MFTRVKPFGRGSLALFRDRSDTYGWTKAQVAITSIIVLFALIIRLVYVHTAVVEHPLRGDTLQYFAYALNLVDHHVFSLAPPDAATRLPDSFRDPGYPTFLALMIQAFGREQPFYLATLDVQAIMAAATVLIYIALARRWFGMGVATFVGLGLTLWPHTITLPGYVLSETLMGLLVAAGLLLTQQAADRQRSSVFLAAGLVLACAALTNATFFPAVFSFAVIAIWKQKASRKHWALLFLAFLLPLGAWTLRGATLGPGQSAGDRVAMNFVQGSWPEYHDAWRSSILQEDAASLATMQRIDSEYALVAQHRGQGLAAMAKRMGAAPLRYLMWYTGKPVELWGWSIGVGMGEIYVFPTYNSPLSGSGVLRITTDAMYFASPLILALAAFGLAVLLVHRHDVQPALWLGVTAVVVITAIFTVLQSDARYAAPYRGVEWLLAGVALKAIALWRQRRIKLHIAGADHSQPL